MKQIHLPPCCFSSSSLGPPKSVLVQARKLRLLRAELPGGSRALRGPVLVFTGHELSESSGTVVVRTLGHPLVLGMKRLEVWFGSVPGLLFCSDSSGIHRNFIHSVCPRIYAFSWLRVSGLQELASQREEYFNENLGFHSSALSPALLIPTDSSRSQRKEHFGEAALTNSPKQTTNNLSSVNSPAHFQEGVTPYCLGRTIVQPAVGQSSGFSSADLAGCVPLGFILAVVPVQVMVVWRRT